MLEGLDHNTLKTNAPPTTDYFSIIIHEKWNPLERRRLSDKTIGVVLVGCSWQGSAGGHRKNVAVTHL